MSEYVIGAIHALTGRQWRLGTDAAWPDLEIVIPFNRQIIDRTGVVLGPVVSPQFQGGYTISNELTTLKLDNLVTGTSVPNLKAVWAGGPGDETARLHLMARDPFSWMVPFPVTLGTCGIPPQAVVEQRFDTGDEETFTTPRRFGEMIVEPVAPANAKLLKDFEPWLPTRVLGGDHFVLRWATESGDVIPVDELTLYLIWIDDPLPDDGPGITAVGHSVAIAPAYPLYGAVSMVEAKIGLGRAVTHVEILGHQTLVYAARYREARPFRGKAEEKILLIPGKYRLTVAGKTTGTPPSLPSASAPPPAPITWGFSQDFDIRYPEMLRPYIGYATVGDNRLFAEDTLAPNPSLHGIGFPLYRSYVPYVRFIVPYISKIFGPLTLKLAYEDKEKTVVEQVVTPGPDPDALSWLPPQSIDWIRLCFGPIVSDEEVAFTAALEKAGRCAFSISFTHPTAGLIEIDRWSAYVSRFESFADHLEWKGATSITITYDPSGKKTRAACPKLSTVGSAPPPPAPPMPDHWKLPTELADAIGTTPLNFFRFAQASGARFTAPGATTDPLDGLCDVVAETTVEALLDRDERPYALWLRTPEAIDWRRVPRITLDVRRVVQTGACPTAYAAESVQLNVKAIPGPDGASAFLVAQNGSLAVRIPRGELTLKLDFSRDVAGLPKLRPGPSAPSPSDQATLTFLQPFGLEWMADITP